MLSHLKIKNFKCFSNQNIKLSNLTMLTGLNAAGKSTVIQSLLLFSQMSRSTCDNNILPLNGDLVRLGHIGDVFNNNSTSEEFGFDFTYNGINYNYKLKASDNHIPALSIKNEVVDHHLITELFNDLIYLSAIRLGAEDVFPSPDSANSVIADVGDRGQYAPWIFNEYESDEIDANRAHPNEMALTLRRQVNAWSNEFFFGSEANAIKIEDTSLVKLQLRMSNVESWNRPINIGYGLTYAFPIIVSGLLAKRGQILIVDSPEAHLHPKGQSMMGHFLSVVAASGVQVIIETHSDHVINGVRLAISNKIINHSDVIINFFKGVTSGSKVRFGVDFININANGKLDSWPIGFFDQIEEDLSRL